MWSWCGCRQWMETGVEPINRTVEETNYRRNMRVWERNGRDPDTWPRTPVWMDFEIAFDAVDIEDEGPDEPGEGAKEASVRRQLADAGLLPDDEGNYWSADVIKAFPRQRRPGRKPKAGKRVDPEIAAKCGVFPPPDSRRSHLPLLRDVCILATYMFVNDPIDNESLAQKYRELTGRAGTRNSGQSPARKSNGFREAHQIALGYLYNIAHVDAEYDNPEDLSHAKAQFKRWRRMRKLGAKAGSTR